MGLFDWFKKEEKRSDFSEALTGGTAYKSAGWSRLTSDWLTSTTSADAELQSSLIVLRNRSRDLVRNNNYAKGACRLLVNSVVGKGIPIEADETVEELFEEWAVNSDWCDCTGKNTFYEMQRLVFKAVFESGEAFVRLHSTTEFGSPIPLALQLIEADQLADNTYSPTAINSGNTYRMGIEFSPMGRPLFYYFRSQHPGDNVFANGALQQTIIRIPADEIVHVYVQERPNQSRGVPWLSSCALKLRDLEQFESYQLLKAKAEASVTGFVTSPEVDLIGDDVQPPQYELSPGRVNRLAPGEGFEVYETKTASANIDSYTASVLRSIAAGLGLSYESLSRDYTNTSYSSARTSRLDEIDGYKLLQDWFTKNFLSPTYKKWVDLALLSGQLSISDFATNPSKYKDVSWIPRGYGWVDPLKEAQAYKLMVDEGFTTREDVIGGLGSDFEEVVEQLAYEKDTLDANGLELGGTPKQLPTQDTSNSNPDDKPIGPKATVEPEDRSMKRIPRKQKKAKKKWG